MIKLFALLAAKQGLDHEAFVRRYEGGHVPLIERLIPVHSHYRRNFIVPDGLVSLGHIEGGSGRPFFDVVTEMKYEDQGKLVELGGLIKQDGIGEQIAADEAAFLDRSKMLMFSVEEHETPADRLQPRPGGQDGPPAVKQVVLLKKKPGMSREAFIKYYESMHAELALRILIRNGKPLFAAYKRNYPIPGGRFDMPHVGGAVPSFDYDCVSEFWYWTQEDYQCLLDLCAERGIGAALELDEGQLFDRSAMCVLTVDERITR